MKSLLTKTFLSLFFLGILTIPAKSQLTIDTTYTVEALVNDFFNSGVLVDVTNISFNGEAADFSSQQIILFENGENTGFVMNEGIAMATGAVYNNLSNTFISFFDPTPTDEDIEQISNGIVNDCAVLEFDVTVNADALAFNFSFASNEYPSFTCSPFNDSFGFFVSGPGIDGPFTDGAVNIATIPNSDTPISINTINSGEASFPGNAPNCEDANPNWQEDTQYFIDNQDDSIPNFFPGYTQNIEAYIEVEQDATYHFKLAICDVADGALDSGVFLESGSFEGRLLSNVDNEISKQISLFPNPGQENIFLDFGSALSGNVQLRVIDVQGRTVKAFNRNVNGQTELNISDIEKGIYFIQISDGNSTVATKRFVKN